MRSVWLIVGVLVFLAGAVFTLQGIGVLPGTMMHNSRTWAILGPIIALVGLVVAFVGTRQKRA